MGDLLGDFHFSFGNKIHFLKKGFGFSLILTARIMFSNSKLAHLKSVLGREATILVTNRWNRSHLPWIFSKFLTFTLHTFVLTQMCHSPSPMLSRAYFWSTEMTANPNQHWGGRNHTSVSRFVTSIVASTFVQLRIWQRKNLIRGVSFSSWFLFFLHTYNYLSFHWPNLVVYDTQRNNHYNRTPWVG